MLENKMLINMSAYNREDDFSTVYYWACSVVEEQLLHTFYCLEFSVKFNSLLNLWPCVFNFSSCMLLYLCNSKQKWQIWWVNNGTVLLSAEWLIIWRIILCRQYHWEFPSYKRRCAFKMLLRTDQKQ
jgi:hypothetical protein